MKVCPAGAISKDAHGIVKVNPDVCIGCKYCFQACPYEVPKYNSVSMDKCDCKFGALQFGPLDELMELTNHSAVPVAQANGPSCLVLGTEK